jgi:hypothetical protein
MDQELLHQLAAERVVRRHAEAAHERLAREARAVEGPVLPAAGAIWSVRRGVGFLLVRVGLRTALGGARC